MTPIVNTVHFHQLHIVKTGRIALFLAAGFARVAIKELLLSGVPHRPPPVPCERVRAITRKYVRNSVQNRLISPA